jgi:hypothetical protein
MDKLIKELAKQATTYHTSYFDGRGNITETVFDQDKFAELIIKECIRIPYDMWDKAELNADIAVKIDHRIKCHFGVK